MYEPAIPGGRGVGIEVGASAVLDGETSKGAEVTVDMAKGAAKGFLDWREGEIVIVYIYGNDFDCTDNTRRGTVALRHARMQGTACDLISINNPWAET